MALPLPRVVPDVGPGGGLVTSMAGTNALANANLLRQINQIKKEYMPLTTQAEAMSKLAYANLMGPQFLAKMLANTDIAANMGDQNAKNAVQAAMAAGMGTGTGNNFLAQMQARNMGPGERAGNEVSNFLLKHIQNVFGGARQPNNSMNVMPGVVGQEPQNQVAPQQQAMTQGNEPQVGETVGTENLNAEQLAAYDRWMKSPEGMAEIDKGGDANYPTPQEVVEWDKMKQSGLRETAPRPKTYFEKAAEAKGILKEGGKLGDIRAQAISDLDEQYQQAVQSEVPIDHLIDMTQDPVFKETLGKIPFYQDKQLQLLSKIGTPEQQQIIGDLTTTATNAVANTINSFRGRILDKEITMANQMKITPKDTWNSMLGKLSSLKTFNEMTKKRVRIASKLMQDKHLNRGDALEQADRYVDAKAIRQKVEKQLNPEPSEEDYKHMMDKYGISKEEVKRRLKARRSMNG